MTVKLTARQKIQVLNADDMFRIMQEILLRENKIDRNKEHFWLVCLSQSNQILMIELVSLGSVKTTVVEPMDVFSFALQKRAVKIIMVHNHPSGQLTPSRADEKLTEKMMAIGHFLDVPVIDHLIITEKGFYSFEAEGLLATIQANTNIDLTFKKQEAQARQLEQQLQLQKKKYLKKLSNEKIKIAKTQLKKGLDLHTVVTTVGLTTEEAAALLPKKKK